MRREAETARLIQADAVERSYQRQKQEIETAIKSNFFKGQCTYQGSTLDWRLERHLRDAGYNVTTDGTLLLSTIPQTRWIISWPAPEVSRAA